MCIPDTSVVSNILNVSNFALQEAFNLNQKKSNNEYRKQIAINNAQNAKNEALRQQQLGINQARIEKISGVQEANRLNARNAASGLNASSQTAKFAYDDILNASNNSAEMIKNQYNQNAKSYFQQANNYLNQASQYNNSFKNDIFNSSYNALGKIGSVSSDWYKNNNNYDSSSWGWF